MPTFDQFLDHFTSSFDPAQFDADAFKTAAKAAHQADQDAAVSVREAKISSLAEQAEAAAAQLKEQKLANYDLLMQTGPKVSSAPVNNFPGSGDATNPDDVDISALFGTLNK